MQKSSLNRITPLSSIDHIFTGAGSYPIEFVFSYNGHLDKGKLMRSLDEVITHFPVVSSVLVKDSEEAYNFEISPDGLLFEEVKSDTCFEDNDKKYEYIQSVVTRENNPLTKIRLTHTPAGSVLGVSISHSIADGFSYFHFLSSWARVYQKKPFLPPVHNRALLLPQVSNDTSHISGEEILDNTGLFLDGKRRVYAQEDLKWESRIFTNEELKQLLSEAQKQTDHRLSFNDILTAQLSREYLPKWRATDEHQMCFISCPVDFRRILPGFPGTYFGNAIVLVTTRLSFDDLQELSLSELASSIRSNIRKVDHHYIQGSLETLTALRYRRNLNIFERIHVMHPQSGLLITNLSRLPVNEIEFSCGPPISFSILTQTIRGAVILPHSSGLEARIGCPVEA